jgi:hypothetical protein
LTTGWQGEVIRGLCPAVRERGHENDSSTQCRRPSRIYRLPSRPRAAPKRALGRCCEGVTLEWAPRSRARSTPSTYCCANLSSRRNRKHIGRGRPGSGQCPPTTPPMPRPALTPAAAGGSEESAGAMLQSGRCCRLMPSRALDRPHLHSAEPVSSHDGIGNTLAEAALAAGRALQRRRPFRRRLRESLPRAACAGG